jgi:LmbE family N-acetylglucosaminyl deacetylase
MKKDSEIFVPDGSGEPYGRTTHLGIGAHQDDIEILAYNGILECFGRQDKWFGAVITSDGAGSARTGIYKDFTNDEMKDVRMKEQKKAAFVGEYSFVSLLKYTSAEIKGDTPDIINDYAEIIKRTRPEVIYTHNLADKHPTHVGVVKKVIRALRSMDKSYHPQKLYGVEIWRDLDWLNDDEKVKLDCSTRLNLERALLGVFDSQIEGGKRYDLATEGRRIANATYSESHAVDTTLRLMYAMDLKPLIDNPNLSVKEFISKHIDDFKNSVLENLKDI